LDAGVVSKWLTFLKIIYQSDQRLLVQVGFPAVHSARVERLCSCLNNEIDQLPPFSDPDECSSEATRMTELSSAIERLGEDRMPAGRTAASGKRLQSCPHPAPAAAPGAALQSAFPGVKIKLRGDADTVGALFVCIAGAHRSNRIFYASNEDDFTSHGLGCMRQS